MPLVYYPESVVISTKEQDQGRSLKGNCEKLQANDADKTLNLALIIQSMIWSCQVCRAVDEVDPVVYQHDEWL